MSKSQIKRITIQKRGRGNKQNTLGLLKYWENELLTNCQGMKEYAEKEIRLIKNEIKDRWPETKFKTK
jgi:hypothetical protein